MPSTQLPTIVAAVVAVVFMLTSAILLSKFGDDWNHAVVIYNTISSIAFSAFGVLLGSKVQEVNVAKATEVATLATADAQKKAAAIKEAAKVLTRSTKDPEAGGGADWTPSTALGASIEAHNILIAALER